MPNTIHLISIYWCAVGGRFMCKPFTTDLICNNTSHTVCFFSASGSIQACCKAGKFIDSTLPVT